MMSIETIEGKMQDAWKAACDFADIQDEYIAKSDWKNAESARIQMEFFRGYYKAMSDVRHS